MFVKYPLCPWTPEGAEDIHCRMSLYLHCTYLGWPIQVFWAKDYHQGRDGKTLDGMFSSRQVLEFVTLGDWGVNG